MIPSADKPRQAPQYRADQVRAIAVAGLRFLVSLVWVLVTAVGAAAAQQADLVVDSAALQDLEPRQVADDTCVVAPLFRPDRSAAEARAALGALAGGEPEPGTYHWVVRLVPAPPAPAVNGPDPTPAILYSSASGPSGAAPLLLDARGRSVAREQLYEAERLTILVAATDGAAALAPRVQAATAVRGERGQLARGFPYFLGELLAAVLPRPTREPGGCGVVTVWRHVTPIGFPDGTVAAHVQVTTSSAVDTQHVLDAFHPRRVEIEAAFLGYTDVGLVLDRLEEILLGPRCSPRPGPDCELALREAAVATVQGIAPTAEHRIRALQDATELALEALADLLGRRRYDQVEIFRVVRRPWIGFSVGGLLTEEASDEVEFEIDDGRVVADGVEGDGFKTLVLLDLYLRPVDLALGGPGFAPHVSVGFTVGDVLQPGAFAGTTLPFTGGRLSPFGGVLLRRETEDATAGGEATLDVDRRLRWVAGLKVGLPVAP